MKKLLFTVCILFFGVAIASAQSGSSAKFNELKHEFGNIQQGKPAAVTFTYKNTGKTPLVIETATATCGCTTPEYPKTPILAGKTGEIKVTYNAAAVGHFTKMVTVKFADIPKPVLLTIEGTVDANTTTAKN